MQFADPRQVAIRPASQADGTHDTTKSKIARTLIQRRSANARQAVRLNRSDRPTRLHQKGLAELIPEEELKQRLASGKILKIKAGFDPTAPDLHLGHTVLLRKMKHFQNLGHEVTFLIGTMTGLIGDPTGRNATRPPLTREQLAANAETYKAQVFKILDPDKTKIRYNDEWLPAPQLRRNSVRLCSQIHRRPPLERDDFSSATASKRPSPSTNCSIRSPRPTTRSSSNATSRGSTDQKFNLLVGRDIMRDYDKLPQIIATVPILEGLDGVEKMSKSKTTTSASRTRPPTCSAS